MGLSTAAPKSALDDAFGELFDNTTNAAATAISNINPTISNTNVDNGDDDDDFGNFEVAG